MVEHHIQKKIIQNLVEHESVRYSQLKPADMDGNVFTYHLHLLIKMGLIEKLEDGTYRLTSKGKLYGVTNSLSKNETLEQAHAIILLSIRSGDKWLLRKRLVQPMFDMFGFVHGEPKAGESIEQSAARILHDRTGLAGKYKVKGFGYITLTSQTEKVSYTNFTLVEVTEAKGKLAAQDAHGQNIWIDTPDFTAKDMIPSMPDLVAKIVKPGLFFLDVTYQVH